MVKVEHFEKLYFYSSYSIGKIALYGRSFEPNTTLYKDKMNKIERVLVIGNNSYDWTF
jgi:hypothetical protein